MINSVSLNRNIAFSGNFSKKLLTVITAGLNSLKQDTFTKTTETKTTQHYKTIAAELLKTAMSVNTPIVEINENTDADSIKQRCISALQGNRPFEKTIVFDTQTGKADGEFDGSKQSCIIKVDNNKPKNSLEIHHGHPQYNINGECFTLPVSMDDLEVLNANNSVKKIIAYDVQGHKSELSKSNDFQPLTKEQLEDLKSDFLVELKKLLPQKTQNQFEYLDGYCKKHTQESPFIMVKMFKHILQTQYSKEGAKTIDKFWENNSEKYNLNYYSEF